MPNDTTHTPTGPQSEGRGPSGIDWWDEINMSGHGEPESSAFTACFGKELEQSDFEAICEWAVGVYRERCRENVAAAERFIQFEKESEDYWNTRTPVGPDGVWDEHRKTIMFDGSAEPKAGDWDARAFIIDHNKRMYSAAENEKQAAFELERSVSILLKESALSSAAPRITGAVNWKDWSNYPEIAEWATSQSYFPANLNELLPIVERVVRSSSPAPISGITGDSDKSDLPIANSVQLSEEMVERVLWQSYYDGPTETEHPIDLMDAIRVIKALLFQQGAEGK